MTNKISCSVGILAFNSGKDIEKALESVKDFDEIIICDGGSTDNTFEIAKRYGCKIIKQDKRFKNPDGSIKDFSGVRNQTLETSTNEWFAYIDSDEYFSKELVDEIRELISHRGRGEMVFDIPRKYVIDGKIIDYATTYPNYQTRLFNKKAIIGFKKQVHESMTVKDGYKTGKLKNYEYVKIDSSIRKIIKKWNSYLEIELSRHREISFKTLVKVMIFHLKTSAGLLLRHIKIIFFCRGRKMPFPLELLRHWYNLKLIFLFTRKYLLKK